MILKTVEEVRRGERFPVKDPDIACSCDGAPTNEGTYVLRLCIHEIKSADDMRTIAEWLKRVVVTRLPKGHKAFSGYGEHKVQ